MKLTKRSKSIIWAAEKGYKVIDNVVLNPKGEALEGHCNDFGYKFVHCKRGTLTPVHRLVVQY